ncbi:MAG: prolipoprotein diacylglyceryl transferase [bacterium]|nr:prolipoprotein diacylglyceryl transferase [bacterium]
MYPNFYFIFKDWFGLELPGLKLVNSFGFFVAVSFVAANLVMTLELKRKFKLGILGVGEQIKVIRGAAMSQSDYIASGITGLIIGYKFLPLLFDFSLTGDNPQAYILSTEGSLLYGILGAAIFLGINYWQDKKQRLPEPIEEIKTIDPSYHMGSITFAAFVGGLLGAKLFHILENLSDFYRDPWGNIISFSGLTFYGGLIVGGIAVIIVAKRKGIKPLHMLDVGGPAMMLSYGTGRIGCHVAGDGDWGIVNTLPKPSWMSFLPDWTWAYNYPNNVNKVCNPFLEGDVEYIANLRCDFEQTPYLVASVFPTPMYEAILGILLFLFLWFLRKRIKYAGVLFGIYLMCSGAERFFIEKIRVNTIMDFMGMHVTQAEIISSTLFIVGLLLVVFGFMKKVPVSNIGTAVE